MLLLLLIPMLLACARPGYAQVELPAASLAERIVVGADTASYWREGVYDVYLLNGNCLINQGLTYTRAKSAVIWVERGGDGGEHRGSVPQAH